MAWSYTVVSGLLAMFSREFDDWSFTVDVGAPASEIEEAALLVFDTVLPVTALLVCCLFGR